jgi:hypothetical protein
MSTAAAPPPDHQVRFSRIFFTFSERFFTVCAALLHV